ncbi:cysteine methyltransferase, partial [Streptomyces spiralis]
MDSHEREERSERQVVWAVAATGIGPLLLAATEDGLVNVVFHATDAVRDRA